MYNADTLIQSNPGVAGAFQAAEIGLRIKDASQNSRIFLQLILRVKGDLEEVLRCENLLRKELTENPSKSAWIKDVIQDTINALTEIGDWVDSIKISDENSRVAWILNYHHKVVDQEKFLATCHRALLAGLCELHSMERQRQNPELQLPAIMTPNDGNSYKAKVDLQVSFQRLPSRQRPRTSKSTSNLSTEAAGSSGKGMLNQPEPRTGSSQSPSLHSPGNTDLLGQRARSVSPKGQFSLPTRALRPQPSRYRPHSVQLPYPPGVTQHTGSASHSLHNFDPPNLAELPASPISSVSSALASPSQQPQPQLQYSDEKEVNPRSLFLYPTEKEAVAFQFFPPYEYTAPQQPAASEFSCPRPPTDPSATPHLPVTAPLPTRHADSPAPPPIPKLLLKTQPPPTEYSTEKECISNPPAISYLSPEVAAVAPGAPPQPVIQPRWGHTPNPTARYSYPSEKEYIQTPLTHFPSPSVSPITPLPSRISPPLRLPSRQRPHSRPVWQPEDGG